jgi:hypothetical protein
LAEDAAFLRPQNDFLGNLRHQTVAFPSQWQLEALKQLLVSLVLLLNAIPLHGIYLEKLRNIAFVSWPAGHFGRLLCLRRWLVLYLRTSINLAWA